MKDDGKSYPIVTFNQIIDTDLGLLQMINNKYHNTNTFYWSLLEAQAKLKLGLLYNRKHSNPLTVIAKDRDNIELLDEYYDQFMKEEYVAILKESIITRLYNAVKEFTLNSYVQVTIVCKNSLEENYLNKIDKDLSSKCSIVVDKNGYSSLLKDDKYSPVYIKNVEDSIPLLDKLKGRSIFIADYRFNFEDDERTKFINNYQEVLGAISNVRVYNIYDKEKDILEGV